MKTGLCAVLSCFVFSTSLNAAAPRLSLAVNSPGTPPNLYYNDVIGIYDGVIPDLLRTVEQDGALTIKYFDSHRARNEIFVAEGRFDMFFSSLAWLKHPERIISTKPIFEHSSYLYSLQPFDADFKLNKRINAKVCARRGFSYPMLEPYFEHGNLERIDSSSHNTMLNMLKLGRCDWVELISTNARAVLLRDDFRNIQLYRSNEPTHTTTAVFILHPSKRSERDILNHYIDAFIKSGQYEASLEKHIKQSVKTSRKNLDG